MKSNKNFGVATIWLIIAGFVLIAGSGYWFYFYQPADYNDDTAWLKKTETLCKETGGTYHACPPCPRNAVCAPCGPPCVCSEGKSWDYANGCVSDMSAINTFDWKTYRNEKYGFEVKYPAEWIMDNNSNVVLFLNQKNQLAEDLVNENRFTVSELGRLDSWPETMGESFKTQIEDDSNYLIDNIKAIRRINSNTDTLYSEYIQFTHNKYAFNVSFNWSLQGNIGVAKNVANKDFILKVFNQILSTFKFLK